MKVRGDGERGTRSATGAAPTGTGVIAVATLLGMSACAQPYTRARPAGVPRGEADDGQPALLSQTIGQGIASEELAGDVGKCAEPFRRAPDVSCGCERWPVKTGRDAPSTPSATRYATIAELRALDRPRVGIRTPRNVPVESTVYVLRDVWLTMYVYEGDDDYHLVVEDDDGNSMIVEIPHPSCMPSSGPFNKGVTASRVAFDQGHDVKGAPTPVRERVSVRGVGFFDVTHGGPGQTGHAPNNFELHPVLGICFGDACTP